VITELHTYEVPEILMPSVEAASPEFLDWIQQSVTRTDQVCPSPGGSKMEMSLSGEFLRVVEQAAIACAGSIGNGDRKGSDRLAVESMRQTMEACR